MIKARPLAQPPGPVGVRGMFGVLKTSPQPTPRMLKFCLKVFLHCWPPCPHSWDIYTARGSWDACRGNVWELPTMFVYFLL